LKKMRVGQARRQDKKKTGALFVELVAAVLLWMGLWGTSVAGPLWLSETTPVVQAWPAVTLLSDPSHTLTLAQVLAQPERFAPPPSPHATLGPRKEAVWLRIPVAVSAQATPRWVLDIDYPALNRVDAYVMSQGRVLRQAVLGSHQPFSLRPLASRSHAMAIELPPGGTAELLLRVETSGAMILPITLSTPQAFHERAVAEQMIQGMLAGLGLGLLVYSLGRWVTLRDSLSPKYALLICGSLSFSMFQFGIGAQYVWRDAVWFEQHAAGVFTMMALAGSFLFIEHALTRPLAGRPAGFVGRHFSRVMKGGAVLTGVLAIVYLLDLIDNRALSAIVSVLGPVPALLGVPGAWSRARQRDPIGWCFLLAWAIYAAATATLIGVINGHLPVNFWTLHSFEFGTAIDMLFYMRVLSLGTQAVHTAAQHATRERDAMRSLAHSDALTGLSNRRGLDAHLATALQQRQPNQLVALYLLDLDGLKPVNDRYGHDAGDQLLVAVAQRLQATMRSADVVARLGGDEFVVLTSGLTLPAQAETFAHKLLDVAKTPFQLGAHRCEIGLTIGYVLAPLDGSDPAELLKQADAAMYIGKQTGKASARRWAPAAAER
jgi:diguanylate cyclase